MAALNFPANPVNGQVYDTYTYDTGVGAWRSASTATAATLVSATAPTSTTSGDLWWNTNDGSFYVNYYDGNSYQWVEGRAPVTAAGYMSPNYLINGAFDIWQRGTSFTSAVNAYTADRWYFTKYVAAKSSTVTKETTTVPSGTGASLKLAITDAGDTSVGIMQFIETANAEKLAGKTVTFSAQIKSETVSQEVQLVVRYTTTVDAGWGATWTVAGSSLHTALAASYQRFSLTTDIPSNAKSVRVEARKTGTTVGGEVLYFANLQLEEGSAATAFRRNANSIQGELAACERYYQVMGKAAMTWNTGVRQTGVGAGDLYYGQVLRTVMRAAPTLAVNTLTPTSYLNVNSTADTVGFIVSGSYAGGSVYHIGGVAGLTAEL